MTAVRLLPGTLGSVCARTGFTWAPASSPAARDAGPISSAPAINDAATAQFQPSKLDRRDGHRVGKHRTGGFNGEHRTSPAVSRQ
jgi:hypothetical protein